MPSPIAFYFDFISPCMSSPEAVAEMAENAGFAAGDIRMAIENEAVKVRLCEEVDAA